MQDSSGGEDVVSLFMLGAGVQMSVKATVECFNLRNVHVHLISIKVSALGD